MNIKIVCFLLLLWHSTPIFSQTNNHSIENIKAFAKVYGYVRYFYPSDEAASIDWENFASYGIKSVIDIKTSDSLKAKLNELFLPIAPLIKIDKEIDTTQDFYKPKWRIFNKQIAWQYIGFENEYPNSFYKCRTNRLHHKYLANKKIASITIDASPYHNDTIKISARIKLSGGTKGYGYLFLKEQDEAKWLYSNNMYYSPINTKDGSVLCEIEGLVLNEAKRIKLGFILKGAGIMVVSDFNVSYCHNKIWKNINLSDQEFIIDKKETIAYNKNIPISMQLSDTAIFEKRRTTFKQIPKPSDFIYDRISDALVMYMPISLFGNNKHTYPIADTVKLNKLKNAINSFQTFDMANLCDRLANVVVVWNVFQYFYPYLSEYDNNWGKKLDYGLRKCYTSSTKESYLMLLRHLLNGFDDGHIHVWGPTESVFCPPMECVWLENKLVVSSVLTDDCPLKIGDIITEVNNKEAGVILDSLNNYVSANTYANKYEKAIVLLNMGEKNSRFNVRIIRNNSERYSYNLKRSINAFDYIFLGYTKLKPYYYQINNSAFYVDFTRIPRDTLAKLLPILQQYKNIIADFRGYPKLRADDWIPHIIDKEIRIQSIFFNEEIVYPNHNRNKLRTYQDRIFNPEEPLINANIIYLINHKTASAAETFLYFLKELNNATFIGQQTAGTTGTMTNFTLRGGYSVSFTGMLTREHDGKLFHGIKPSIEVKNSIEGLKQGKDEVLEKAINFITNY